MPTPSGHTRVIAASKVKGTSVYGTDGKKIGSVEDVFLDKMSNEILFAALALGGFLGIGEKYHPVPWAGLDYSEERGGYIIPFTKEQLEKAPAYKLDELGRNESGIREEADTYYGGLHS